MKLISLFKIVLIIILLLVFFQDIKYRRVHILLFLLLGLIGLLLCILIGLCVSLDLLFSFLFIISTMASLWLYLSIIHKNIVNLTKGFIGEGDILFFVVIIPLFSFERYVFFFIMGLFLSVIIHLLFSKNKQQTIPLAGYLSIMLTIFLIFELVTGKKILQNI